MLLDISPQTAKLSNEVFDPDGRHDAPGHQEVELGSAKLYRVTSKARWLARGSSSTNKNDGRPVTCPLCEGYGLAGYSQDHLHRKGSLSAHRELEAALQQNQAAQLAALPITCPRSRALARPTKPLWLHSFTADVLAFKPDRLVG